MYIKDGKRFNVYAPVEVNGMRFTNATDPVVRNLLGVTSIDEPQPPEGYSEDTHYRTEIDDSPYVVYTEKPTEVLDALRWDRLKTHRDNLTDQGGVYVASVDKWFHTDPKSKLQQVALTVMGANLPAGIMWKTMDGSFVELTPTLVQQIFGLQAAREQAIFAVAEQKRLDQSPLYEGWPDNYVPLEPEEPNP